MLLHERCGAGRDIDPEPYARPAGPASGPRPHRGSTGRLDLEGGSEPCRGPSPSLVVLEVALLNAAASD
ncbi:hypothetical protein HPB47_020255 [Ixodes persulcatus]|uniref:Uncharacterized protein n=1 Tax=Ixodes persulcatus TaxID=34615 RepID=A0AC60QGV8_IXOPE|nr:hypothetical protein HPB47_020255 [Ixodes persulcatus]